MFFQFSFTLVIALPIASAPQGTFSVTTEPAAMNAPSPMSTGATMVELLPTNTRLPSRERCFTLPS